MVRFPPPSLLRSECSTPAGFCSDHVPVAMLHAWPSTETRACTVCGQDISMVQPVMRTAPTSCMRRRCGGRIHHPPGDAACGCHPAAAAEPLRPVVHGRWSRGPLWRQPRRHARHACWPGAERHRHGEGPGILLPCCPAAGVIVESTCLWGHGRDVDTELCVHAAHRQHAARHGHPGRGARHADHHAGGLCRWASSSSAIAFYAPLLPDRQT